jgi:protocatechuate 3,4-dioxygenase beta subunit
MFESLELRQMLSVTFLEQESNDTLATAQAVVSPGLTSGAVDMISPSSGSVAQATDNNPDYFKFSAAVIGDVNVAVVNLGGDPDGDGGEDDWLEVTVYDDADAVIAGPTVLQGAGQTFSFTVAAANTTDVYKVRVQGDPFWPDDDADYQVRIWNQDREDDAGGNNNARTTATDLGNFGGALTASDYTITRPDRDYFKIASTVTGPVEVRAVMPVGTGVPGGVNGPTNLGLRVRDAGGVILATSNGTITNVDVASFDAVSGQEYYIEVYSGSVGQVNTYDLELGQPTGAVTGFKFEDLNGDGFQDWGEPGLANWTVYVDTNDNGSLDGGEPSTTTAPDGSYSLTLPVGSHVIREVLPAGWLQTYPGPDEGNAQRIDVSSSMVLDHIDFGNFELLTISGMKFEDLNGNGVQDAGDDGLPGWTIELDRDANGTVDATATTDANGNYSFPNLGPGTYRVREQLQAGWIQTTLNPSDIIAVSGTNVGDVDFGNFELIAISGMKFEDTNGNGVQDAGENGLPGWTIELDRDANGSVDATATTDANGNYSFANLGPGTYRVREVLQAGWVQTTTNPADITAVSGTNASNVSFGNFELITISGMKFEDVNGNGVQDAGDNGLQGWTIELDRDANGSVDATATTDANGNYSFTNVGPGTYRIREVLQPGWVQTTTNPADIAALSGTNVGNVDFGNFELITISGMKFEDVNGNGVQDAGDNGLQGWTIELDRDANGSVDATATTDANGNYSFTNVGPGTYRIREVLQPGWVQTTTNPADIAALSGTDVGNVNFGNFELITISGMKFEDTNGNGVKDAGDNGLANWTIELDRDANGSVDATATTDANGNYSFTNVGPGTYRVREALQAGWLQTTSNPADITALSGTNVNNVNFGNFELITISGMKFEDVNGNGVQDAGDNGLQGWTIELDRDANGSVDGTATTDANGNYSFPDLGPGTYRVREVLQAGWVQTTTNPADITAVSGTNASNVNFGNFELITISGMKFEDVNGNGVQDAGDNGLQGWTIELDRDANGSVDATATTDANGNYSFTNVGPGTYRIREVLQAGWVQTTTNPADIAALSGTNVGNVDFGNFELITISGMKFEDLNGNGVKDAGDSGLGGWTIQLDKDANGSVDATATTDGGGNYSFANLGPGVYRVREVLQAGWVQTTSNPADITAASGVNVSGLDVGGLEFGNFELITISGMKFEDLNGNGVKDAGDNGLPGWTIQLDRDANGSVDATATTDANGNYSFTNVGPGTYRVREVLQPGWLQTTANPADITAVSGTNVNNIDFGNFELIAISGMKFEDLNGNGVKDAGDNGLQGWTIQLDQDANGSVDATTTTDANGNYNFSNLGPGTYRVREQLQTGWIQTTANPADVTAVSGTNVSTVDFGNFELITIGGMKFEDINGNGVKDAGDNGLPGWTIELDKDANGSVDATATTDANGNYSFPNVGPGVYRVREVGQAGWVQTTGNPADITAVSGTNVSTVDFGNFELITISGMKFEDLNGNGTKELNEPGLPGWTIQLDKDANGSVDDTRTTDANGNYSFTDLGPGVYRLREVLQAGWIQRTPNPPDISAQSGVDLTDVDFGNSVEPAMTGTKYYDENKNGQRDVGEIGLEGWTIELYADVNDNGVFEPNGPFGVAGADGDPVYTAVTNSNGLFGLGPIGLANGQYFVREVVQSGWRQTNSPPYNKLPYYPVYPVEYTGTTVSGLDFGNVPCTDILNVDDSPRVVTSERDGILTIILTQGTFTVERTDDLAFDAYDGAGGVLDGVTSVSSQTETLPGADGQLGTNDDVLRERVDILITGIDFLHPDPNNPNGLHPTPAGTAFDLAITGAGGTATLTVVNSVNVDVAGSLALIITGTECGELIAVGDDKADGANSDAKAIFFGTVCGAYNNGTEDLEAEGVQYDKALMDAMFGTPSISIVQVNALGGDDIVRVKDEIAQQSTLDGGEGNDNVRGGSGKATIFGGAGIDLLIGGISDDIINGNDGHDRIFGGAGADRAYGGAGEDWIAGGDGDDPLLRGGDDNDHVSGGRGRDRLYGDNGIDTAYRERTSLPSGSFVDLLVSAELIIDVATAGLPDVIEQVLEQLIDNYWNDSFLTNEVADLLDNDGDGAIDEADELVDDTTDTLVNQRYARDTLDELIDSILP